MKPQKYSLRIYAQHSWLSAQSFLWGLCPWLFALCQLGALLLALSPAASAEPPGVPRIGYLASFGLPTNSTAKFQLDAFRQGLRDLGYTDGKNIVIEYRQPKDNSEQALRLAAELIGLKVDVVVAVDPTAIRAAKQASTTTPVIMVTNQDPVAAGFVQSLARPGGNVTGLTRLTRELSGKRLEILKEVVPSISRVGILWVRPTALGTGNSFKNYEAASDGLKIQLLSVQVRRPNPDLDGAFQTAVKEHATAVIPVNHAVLSPHAKKIAELAANHRLPSMCEAVRYVDAGCLMSYASDDADTYRRAAIYVDKILKGAKPADLPVEQPTKFELVINLKAAKRIGLTIPQSVLYKADKVIK